MRTDMRLMQSRCLQDGVDPRHGAPDAVPVGDRADAIGERSRKDVEADRRGTGLPQRAHQRLAQMA
jgi:hypothetical protein